MSVANTLVDMMNNVRFESVVVALYLSRVVIRCKKVAESLTTSMGVYCFCAVR